MTCIGWLKPALKSPHPFNLSPKDGAGVVVGIAVNRYGVLYILSMDEAKDSISALDPVT